MILPEILDLARYTHLDWLPSRKSAPATTSKSLEYELVSVNNWKSGHYIGYSLVKIQNEMVWVMFNDHDVAPLRKTPFESLSEVRDVILLKRK